VVLSPTRSKAYQRGLGYFPQVAMVGTPFVSESARACQYNFDLFRTLGDAGLQNANEGSFEILRTAVVAAVSAAKKHQFCQPSCARHRKKFAGDTPGH
jgi:hypothetical protein